VKREFSRVTMLFAEPSPWPVSVDRSYWVRRYSRCDGRFLQRVSRLKISGGPSSKTNGQGWMGGQEVRKGILRLLV